MAFRLYFGHICGNLCVFTSYNLILIFYLSFLHFDSIIGNVRSLVTNIRYEHRHGKSKRSLSTSPKYRPPSYDSSFGQLVTALANIQHFMDSELGN